MPILLKRAYDPPSPADGMRVLVDRLWPRGVSKEEAEIDRWLRDLAPSNELRSWFHEHPSRWLLFRRRYLQELSEPEAAAALEKLYELAHKHKTITLIFASRDGERNNAVVLKELLEGMRKPPGRTGPASGAARARQSRSR